ncbi:MAG: hypothetical protein ACOCXZ_01770 [Chloroflexota bacterium]
MDIQHLVDRMEDLIDEGRHMPFSRFTLIDEERALEIIDQMRISIPDEIEKANRILAQRDRVLAQANEEAARILQQARTKGEQMLDQDISVQAAQNRAMNVVEEARQEAARVRAEADSYVVEVLGRLEQLLTRNLSTVRNGINAVRTEPGLEPVADEDAIEPMAGTPAQFPQTEIREEVEVNEETRFGRPSISLRRGGQPDSSEE